MGEVYVALQTGIGRFARPIAVKLLLPHLADDEKVVSMFLTEARVGAQMTHANIAQVYDVGLERDRYFIAMELVRGVSMSTLIAGLKGAQVELSPELLAYVGRSLCEGLHVAHEQKGADGRSLELVHRDVTPHNVLISVDGAVKLTDFGIARVADADRLSRPGVLLGKLGYLAPEQLKGEAIDRRVDLFATGATLYHLAALQKPFDTPTGSVIDPQRLPTVPLRVCRPDLPRQLIDAIEKAMAIAPSERWATAKELRGALPVPGPDAAEELGRLVRQVCAAALVELEQKTERATAVIELESADVGAPLVDGQTAPSVSEPRARSRLSGRPRVVVMGALAVLGCAAVAVWLGSAPPVSVAPSESSLSPVPSSGPVSAVESLATREDARAGGGHDDRAPEPAIERAEARVEPRRPTSDGVGKVGRLSIDAAPWAMISLDGQPLGETPLADVRVALGAHTLVGTNPETGKTVRQKVTVSASKPLAVRLDLR